MSRVFIKDGDRVLRVGDVEEALTIMGYLGWGFSPSLPGCGSERLDPVPPGAREVMPLSGQTEVTHKGMPLTLDQALGDISARSDGAHHRIQGVTENAQAIMDKVVLLEEESDRNEKFDARQDGRIGELEGKVDWERKKLASLLQILEDNKTIECFAGPREKIENASSEDLGSGSTEPGTAKKD